MLNNVSKNHCLAEHTYKVLGKISGHELEKTNPAYIHVLLSVVISPFLATLTSLLIHLACKTTENYKAKNISGRGNFWEVCMNIGCTGRKSESETWGVCTSCLYSSGI
jgi:hypothetical protein